MNVTEINDGSVPSLRHYFAAALPLTAITVWIIVALQIQMNESPSPPRRVKAPPPIKKPGDPKLHMNGNGISAPPGHELRPAYTSPEGDEIVVASPDTQFNAEYQLHEKSNGQKADHNPGGLGYGSTQHGEHGGPQRASIWKRLLWPVTLTRYTFEEWQENRRRTAKHRQKHIDMDHLDHRESSNRPSSLPFFNNHRKRNEMTPAARLAADVRSQHSGSSKSMTGQASERPATLSLSHSPRLPPILRHEGQEQAIEERVVRVEQDCFGNGTMISQVSNPDSRVRNIESEPITSQRL